MRSRALLREEGLLELRRGMGIRVAGTPERGLVLARARELLELARTQGYRRDELLEMIQRL
jgi:GntR family transcriptional regulator